jgi:hypothetical protein
MPVVLLLLLMMMMSDDMLYDVIRWCDMSIPRGNDILSGVI